MNLFLTVRVLHVLLGAAWLGAAVFSAFFLMPSIQEAGAEGGKVMGLLVRRKLIPYIASISGLTVVTGVYLFWHFTSGFEPAFLRTASAHVYAGGGVLGLVAAILATTGVTRNIKKAMALMGQAASSTDAAARTRLIEQAAALRQRARTSATIVAVLLIITIMAMAAGQYV
jgi:hypothetical protein